MDISKLNRLHATQKQVNRIDGSLNPVADPSRPAAADAYQQSLWSAPLPKVITEGHKLGDPTGGIRGLTIVGTEFGCGKTSFASGCVLALQQDLLSVRVLKPIVIGRGADLLSVRSELAFLKLICGTSINYPIALMARGRVVTPWAFSPEDAPFVESFQHPASDATKGASMNTAKPWSENNQLTVTQSYAPRIERPALTRSHAPSDILGNSSTPQEDEARPEPPNKKTFAAHNNAQEQEPDSFEQSQLLAQALEYARLASGPKIIELPGGCATVLGFSRGMIARESLFGFGDALSDGQSPEAAFDVTDAAIALGLPCIVVAKHAPDAIEKLTLNACYLRSRGVEVAGMVTVESDPRQGRALDTLLSKPEVHIALTEKTGALYLGSIRYSPTISIPAVTQGNLAALVSAGVDTLPLTKFLSAAASLIEPGSDEFDSLSCV